MSETKVHAFPVEQGAATSGPTASGAEEEPMSNEGSNSLMAFLLGALTGGVAALLFAPSSGRELREKIGESAEKARATAQDTARQTRERVHEKYEEGTEKARELATSARESAETRGKAVKEAIKEGKAAYERELAKAD
jgi:gas vesicle protein